MQKTTYLHEELTKEFRQNIENEVWTAHSKIPTEHELCGMHGVSRITVRQALGTLEREGYIERRQGKGTFVSQPKIEQPLGRFYTFTDQIERLGIVPSSRMYELRLLDASPEMTELFHLPEPRQLYFGIRLRLADGMPVALEHFYLPAYLFPGLTAHEIEENGLYSTMLKKYGVEPDRAEETFEAILLNNTEAELLQWENKKPGIRLERFTYSKDVLIEDSKAVIRGDRYKCRIQLVK
ncbi:MAG: GntR family transcriptional regulator [Clostridiales bacterium]|nr:GntR family transcriptional regulator [Clostridiales bacterium]